MATKTMRRIREGEVPIDGGTAVQDDPARPVFRGNGDNDYVCAECGNVLAIGMNPEHMGRRVRIKCGRCRTVNIAAEVPVEMARRRAEQTGGG
jgi:phage FluMu protein Com